MRKKCWEDFELGLKFNSNKVTVTEAHMVSFAGITGDWYPLHMDEEYAKQTKFGGRIAHGPLTFCLAIGLVGQTNIFEDSLVAFIGMDNFRLLAPVKPGDTIGVEVEIIGKQETSNPKTGITIMQYRVKNQRGELILKSDMNFMMHRRN